MNRKEFRRRLINYYIHPEMFLLPIKKEAPPTTPYRFYRYLIWMPPFNQETATYDYENATPNSYSVSGQIVMINMTTNKKYRANHVPSSYLRNNIVLPSGMYKIKILNTFGGGSYTDDEWLIFNVDQYGRITSKSPRLKILISGFNQTLYICAKSLYMKFHVYLDYNKDVPIISTTPPTGKGVLSYKNNNNYESYDFNLDFDIESVGCLVCDVSIDSKKIANSVPFTSYGYYAFILPFYPTVRSSSLSNNKIIQHDFSVMSRLKAAPFSVACSVNAIGINFYIPTSGFKVETPRRYQANFKVSLNNEIAATKKTIDVYYENAGGVYQGLCEKTEALTTGTNLYNLTVELNNVESTPATENLLPIGEYLLDPVPTASGITNSNNNTPFLPIKEWEYRINMNENITNPFFSIANSIRNKFSTIMYYRNKYVIDDPGNADYYYTHSTISARRVEGYDGSGYGGAVYWSEYTDKLNLNFGYNIPFNESVVYTGYRDAASEIALTDFDSVYALIEQTNTTNSTTTNTYSATVIGNPKVNGVNDIEFYIGVLLRSSTSKDYNTWMNDPEVTVLT